MGKRSNGKLRAQRLVERALRKGVDPYASADSYVWATDGTHLSPIMRSGKD